jgi:hypothetical protein
MGIIHRKIKQEKGSSRVIHPLKWSSCSGKKAGKGIIQIHAPMKMDVML